MSLWVDPPGRAVIPNDPPFLVTLTAAVTTVRPDFYVANTFIEIVLPLASLKDLDRHQDSDVRSFHPVEALFEFMLIVIRTLDCTTTEC